MPKLSELALRTLTPANYRFSSEVISAVQVQDFMLEDNVIDFSRTKLPKYREVLEEDLLRVNDVVIGLTGARGKAILNSSEREITSVGLYHPKLSCPEPVTLAPYTLAFRAANLSEAVSVLAGLIYLLDSRRNLGLIYIRQMPIMLLTDEQVTKFLELLRTAFEMRTNMRKRDKLMRELIPATIAKFLNDNERRVGEEVS